MTTSSTARSARLCLGCAARAEVGGRGGFALTVSVVANCTTLPLELLCQFASGGRSGFPANTHRFGAGRRRIRRREELHLHPATTRGAERDSRQARKENMVYSRSARRNAAGIPVTPLP